MWYGKRKLNLLFSLVEVVIGGINNSMCFVVKAPLEDLRNAAPELSAYGNLIVFASELDY